MESQIRSLEHRSHVVAITLMNNNIQLKTTYAIDINPPNTKTLHPAIAVYRSPVS